MTMSVGLGRIEYDPKATVLTRKALGILSTPGLLVHDTGLSIDDDGRIYLKLKTDGGLTQDEAGVSVVSTAEVGLDREVSLLTEPVVREWNARLTGNAPNYFEGSLAIGSESLIGVNYYGQELQAAKLQVTNPNAAQLRLASDLNNFLAFRTLEDGTSELYVVGDSPQLHIMTGDGNYEDNRGGIRLNNGTEIEQIIVLTGSAAFGGSGTVGAVTWMEVDFTYSPSSSAYNINSNSDVVSIVIQGGTAPPAQMFSWCARIKSTNVVSIRVAWFDVMALTTIPWLMLVHRLRF